MSFLALLRVVSWYLKVENGGGQAWRSLQSLTLSHPGEGRTALPLAYGWHHFFAKQLEGVHGRLVCHTRFLRSTGHLYSLSATL